MRASITSSEFRVTVEEVMEVDVGVMVEEVEAVGGGVMVQ